MATEPTPTDAEIDALWNEAALPDTVTKRVAVRFARAVLARWDAQPAPAASVLEDAARWQFAEANMTYAEFKDGSYFNVYMWPQAESKEAARAAIDAARKQGANHD